MPIIQLPSERITDWHSFHQVCQEVFGFPDFYGMNMNAWIDCLTYIDDGDGMSAFHLAPGERLDIEVPHTKQFQSQAPDIFAAFLDSVAFVNQRHIADGKSDGVHRLLSAEGAGGERCTMIPASSPHDSSQAWYTAARRIGLLTLPIMPIRIFERNRCYPRTDPVKEQSDAESTQAISTRNTRTRSDVRATRDCGEC